MQKEYTREHNLLTLAGLGAALTGAACLIPAASHLTAIPLYQLSPMTGLLLLGMWAGRGERWQEKVFVALLAVLMPVVSALLTGMPAGMKVVCMAAELLTIVAVWYGWRSKASNGMRLVGIITALLTGKIVYYALKAMLIGGALVGTNLWIQAGALLVWAGMFVMLSRKQK